MHGRNAARFAPGGSLGEGGVVRDRTQAARKPRNWRHHPQGDAWLRCQMREAVLQKDPVAGHRRIWIEAGKGEHTDRIACCGHQLCDCRRAHFRCDRHRTGDLPEDVADMPARHTRAFSPVAGRLCKSACQHPFCHRRFS